VSTTRGLPFKNETWYRDDPQIKKPFTELNVQIRDEGTRKILVDTWVPVNATDFEVSFSLASLNASLNRGSQLWVLANSPDAIQTYQSYASITVLPERNDTGSVARVDSLYGGIELKSQKTWNQTWEKIFPYSFYTSWDWIASTINNSSATKNLTTFRSQGYNIIHPVPPGGDDPFNHTLFSQFLTICDELKLYVMYDMRHTYKNNTSISDQLSRLTSHPSLLLYYTADEPDGWCDPLDATKNAYKHIKSIDPYHPVSLVLNCANFHFRDYTAGADIILEDTYPIAINSSYSVVYETECNSTYGDCGCDNCHVGDPSYPAIYTSNRFIDIVERVNNLYAYQDWIGGVKKPIWGVPQAFWDQGSFWGRWPTAAESVVMSVLRLNHGGKGIVGWIYPTSDEIEDVSSKLARVLTHNDATWFTLNSHPVPLEVTGGNGLVDAVGWTVKDQSLISVVYQGYEDLNQRVEIKLPLGNQTALVGMWPPYDWKLEGGKVYTDGMKGLEVAIFRAY
jgi:hypothetical protein